MRYSWCAVIGFGLGLVLAVKPAAADMLTLPFGGYERRVMVERPESQQPKPLVIMLHGNAQSANDVRMRMNWEPLIAQGDVVVAFPEAVNFAWADGRDPQAFLGRKPVAGVDDVAFLVNLVDLLARQGIIDRTRVFVAGLSNGGMMTYRLLCERPDVFAGGAAIAANLWPNLAETCHPQQARPLLVMNGTNDRVVPFEASEPDAITKGSVYTIGTPATLALWRQRNGCSEEARADSMPDIDPLDRSKVLHIAWRCPPGKDVDLYRVEGGGHRIPALAPIIDRLAIDRYAGGQNLDIDAAHEIWSFFAKTSRTNIAQRLGNTAQ